jgi:hypothetical protein
VLSFRLTYSCTSSSTRCQSISRFGPSVKPSRDTTIHRTIFRIADLPYAEGVAGGGAVTWSSPSREA